MSCWQTVTIVVTDCEGKQNSFPWLPNLNSPSTCLMVRYSWWPGFTWLPCWTSSKACVWSFLSFSLSGIPETVWWLLQCQILPVDCWVNFTKWLNQVAVGLSSMIEYSRVWAASCFWMQNAVFSSLLSNVSKGWWAGFGFSKHQIKPLSLINRV